jgi:hypothetical protein
MIRILLTIFISLSLQAQQKINRCAEEKEALISYQKQMRLYESNGSSMQDLLERKNTLNANLALYDALTGIMNEYYNYLSKSSDPDVRKIDQLQLFLQAQAPAAHRMNLSVDMINTIDDAGKLPRNRKERFPIIKARLQNKCSQNPELSYCQDLGPSFWSELTAKKINRNATNVNQLMVENFIHLSSAAKDIGKDLIDNTSLVQVLKNDPSVQKGLTANLSRVIDEAAKSCANRDLLSIVSSTNSQRCLDVKLTELKSNNGTIQKELGLGGEPTLGKAIDTYFKKIKRTKQSQVKITSQALKEVLRSSSPNFRSADRALDQGAKRKYAVAFEKKKRKLAGNIHGAFKIMLGNRTLSTTLTNGTSSQGFNPNAEKLAPLINKTLKDITGYEGRDLFKVTKGSKKNNSKISFNHLALTHLLNTNALSSRALKDKQLADINNLKDVQTQMNNLSKNKRFAGLDAMREFTWSNVRNYCSRNDNEYVKPASKCTYQTAYSEGLNTLLKTSHKLSDINDAQYDLQQLNRILKVCADKNTPARSHTCKLAKNKKERLTSVYEQAEEDAKEKAQRRKELLSNDTHVYEFDENWKITGQRKRKNGYLEGLNRGTQSSVEILYPMIQQKMALGPQLQKAAAQGKARKTYLAWMNRPQYDCRIYVCPQATNSYYQYSSLGLTYPTGIYSSPTSIIGPQGYQQGYNTFPQTNISQQLSKQSTYFNYTNTGADSFNLPSRPTSP